MGAEPEREDEGTGAFHRSGGCGVRGPDRSQRHHLPRLEDAEPARGPQQRRADHERALYRPARPRRFRGRDREHGEAQGLRPRRRRLRLRGERAARLGRGTPVVPGRRGTAAGARGQPRAGLPRARGPRVADPSPETVATAASAPHRRGPAAPAAQPVSRHAAEDRGDVPRDPPAVVLARRALSPLSLSRGRGPPGSGGDARDAAAPAQRRVPQQARAAEEPRPAGHRGEHPGARAQEPAAVDPAADEHPRADRARLGGARAGDHRQRGRAARRSRPPRQRLPAGPRGRARGRRRGRDRRRGGQAPRRPRPREPAVGSCRQGPDRS